MEGKKKVELEPVKMKICKEECNCCIDQIYASIQTDPQEWKEMEEMRFAITPLHRAAEAGNTAVAVEILNLMPSLGRKLNPEGLSPLHVAIEERQRETAGALARLEKQLVRVKGKGGLTPLMQCAARSGEEDRRLLASLLLVCPDSVADVNNSCQTVVHVALVNGNCDAVCVLVNWLRRRDQISSVLTLKDAGGNTVLHAAAQFGCVKGAKKLVELVKLNTLNSDNKTALDVAIQHNQTAVENVLKGKGAKSDQTSPATNPIDYVLTEPSFAEAISRAFYYLTKELTLEMRGTVLVVATLIVAATYQAVLQPPGGVYPPPEEKLGTTLLTSHHNHHMRRRLLAVSDEVWRKHLAGQMVMEENHYRYFMPSNTFAFALSAVIIIFVVPGTPIFLILHFCLVFMCVGYLLALDAISYYTGISDMIYGMALYAIIGAFIVKILYYPIKALLVEDDWWLRRFSVKVSNCWGRHGGDRGFAKAMHIAHKMQKQNRVLDLK